MTDEKFEKTMDDWASHEEKSAPQLRPTEEMYRMIEARNKRTRLSIYARRVLVGVAAACFALSIIVLLPSIKQLSDDDGKPSMGLRTGFASEKGATIKQPTRGKGHKGPKKGATISFKQLMFHYHECKSPSAYGFDIRFLPDEKVALTADDNYKLIIQPAIDLYVYVYQLDSSGKLTRLFPNANINNARNPLKESYIYHLPAKPNWLFLGKKPGMEKLYILASEQPISQLDDLYEKYSQEAGQEKSSPLLKQLEHIEQDEYSGVIKWEFSFEHK